MVILGGVLAYIAELVGLFDIFSSKASNIKTHPTGSPTLRNPPRVDIKIIEAARATGTVADNFHKVSQALDSLNSKQEENNEEQRKQNDTLDSAHRALEKANQLKKKDGTRKMGTGKG